MLDPKQKIFFAKHILDAIANVQTPILAYEEEKEVVREALRKYINNIEDDMRGR